MVSGTRSVLAGFRDPGGRVWIDGERVLRSVNPAGLENWRLYRDSPTVAKFTRAGRFIGSELIDDRAEKLLVAHEAITPITYPGEWTYGMLQAAALLILDVAEALLAEGLGLKDASPFNVLFRRAEPVFVDVLSIERRDPQDPLWRPLAEFRRTFVIPLGCCRDLEIPLSQTLGPGRDGPEIERVLRWAGPVRKWLAPWRTNVTMPALLSGAADKPGTYLSRRTSTPEEAQFVLKKLFRRLREEVVSLSPESRRSTWSSYREANTYSTEDRKLKANFLGASLKGSERVLDVGANTGEYAFVAEDLGCDVVALENDSEAANRLWRNTGKRRITTIVADIASPTSGGGWRGRERQPLLERLGRFEAVILFAVVHHLIVSARIPLEEIVDLIADLCGGVALVEYVDRHDPQFERLLRGREDLHRDWTREFFENEWGRRFQIAQTVPLGNPHRTLYQMIRRIS